MKIIVTGSEGFIGGALCPRLERDGHEVLHIDRSIGGEAASIGGLLATGEIGCVFHLAAQTSVFNERLEDIERDNVRAFMAVATLCNRHGVKLVYASSSTANPVNTTSMYGISKQFDEKFAQAYCPSATGVRLHNVYGKRPRQGTLLWHVLNDKVVTLYNGGRNIRHFTHVSDAVEGLAYAASCCLPLVNVRNPQRTSVSEFVEACNAFSPVRVQAEQRARELDNFEQTVDERIFAVPLQYKPVEAGLRQVFME